LGGKGKPPETIRENIGETAMKEIKAFIRTSVVEEVIHALKTAGFRCMSIITVSGIGMPLADAEKSTYSIEFLEKYSQMAKIELVCSDADEDRIVEIIKNKGRTHQPGDGIIFVSDISRAIKIRTGEEGEEILQV